MSDLTPSQQFGEQLRATRAGRVGESQELPVGNDLPSMHDSVLADMSELMERRKAIGVERYGQPLQPFNTRDAGMDAWEEAGDLLVYMRQLMFEHRFMWETLRLAHRIIGSAAPRTDVDVNLVRERVERIMLIKFRHQPAASDGER